MPWLQCEHSVRGTKSQVKLLKVLTTIGRASGNDLVLDDPSVSASHATLVRKGTSYTLSLADRGGSLTVNGQGARSANLEDGDRIGIGPWHLVFRTVDPASEVAPEGEAVSLDLLESLVALSADMMGDTTPERLFATLLRGLVGLTRAEKGFIVLLQDGERHMAASHNVENRKMDLTRVSDSIIDQVTRTLQPIIVSDAMQDPRFGRAQSVVDLKLSSVMCVPLLHQNDLLGVIYLGNDNVTDLFTERDLAVLRIYAAQAAIIVFHALMLNQLKLDNRNLRDRLKQASQGEIIGTHPAMKAVFRVLRRVAPTDLSVLILGETGTGKELVARELHRLSERRDAPFVAINCGAIPEHLLESELFGHRKGSFTGAVADKIGKIEAASGGTLFLDEIGEMPVNLQVKLLRVLQERTIDRVGDVQPRPVDIRVVAATNRNPEELIKEGHFREDLYYRLNEITVTLPPLRDRGEDVVVLAQYFLHAYRDQYGVKGKGFSNSALTSMKAYYWPGNVRELESRIKKAIIMSDRPQLGPEDLGLGQQDKRHVQSLADAQEEFKVGYIRRVLEMNDWNKAQTARDLDIDARTVFRYIEKIREDE